MDALSHPGDFERSDADPRLIAALALGLVIFLAATPLLLRVIYPTAVRVTGIERDLPRPPAPALEIHPRVTLHSLRAREDAVLHSYGWIDRDRHIVRIPIERATQLLAERGLAGWPSSTAPTSR